MDGRIFDLYTDLNAELDRNWTVPEMAQKAGLSTSHLLVLFKSTLGTSPGTYLKEKRLEKAKCLLETTYDQIKQIAVQIGMPEESHFTRNFKAKFGLNPSEYRRYFQEKRQAELLNGQKS